MPNATRHPASRRAARAQAQATRPALDTDATSPTTPPLRGDRLLRRPDMLAKVGMTYTAVHQAMKVGRFPRPVQLGERAVAWRESELDAWIAALPRAEGLPCG